MRTKVIPAILVAAAGLLLNSVVHAADVPALAEPVKSVFTNYLAIHASLAEDSFAGVSEHAGAIAKAVRSDRNKMLPAEVATQAEALAKAKDLGSAREAFKPLSNSLISYLADHKVKSNLYDEVYCPMENASWIQTSETIENPYLGKSMPGCGIVKRTF